MGIDPRTLFQRTSCDCAKCTEFCRSIPGNLIPGDAGRIAEYIGIKESEIWSRLLASPGAIVINTQIGKAYRIGTIVPARKADNSCTFLSDDGKCSIHPVAPFACSHFDSHMDDTQANTRSAAMLLFIENDTEYKLARQRLWDAGRRAKAPEVLRATGATGIDTEESKRRCGRNNPCPCGSGTKYKKCCGGTR